MNRRLRVSLLLGILGGLFISACAGVAAGRVDLPAGGEEFFTAGGPSIDMQSLPNFEFSRPANSATYIFEKAEIQGLSTVQTASEALAQGEAQMYGHAFCSRGGP